jgi:hypothetical protein
MPRLLLHLEGLVVLASALLLYGNQNYSWLTFVLLLLLPDLSMVFYVVSQRVGSIAYNLVHTLVFPVGLALLSYFSGHTLGMQIALIWLAHIGMDHTFGYGFKYPGIGKETHFTRI